MTKTELRTAIANGEVDINNQTLFLKGLIKGFLYDISKKVRLRNNPVPHVILNTGGDILWLENKGQDAGVEPYEISNENGIYSQVPRCVVTMGGIEVLEDQLTNPFTRGMCDFEYEGEIWGLNLEFRRMPLKVSMSLKYVVDTFGDSLALTQYIMSNLLFINTFDMTYLGQTITSSYKVPANYNTEMNLTFDGGTTESKYRTISLDIDIETNLPIYNGRTVVFNDEFISSVRTNINGHEHDTGPDVTMRPDINTDTFVDGARKDYVNPLAGKKLLRAR